MDHQAEMESTKALKHALQEALGHLYDPDFDPHDALCRLLGRCGASSPIAVQSAIIGAIEDARPTTITPPGSRAARAYELLESRFLLGLTLEETAERLSMSVSSTKRTQRQAVHMLAVSLWKRANALQVLPSGSNRGAARSEQELSGAQADDWGTQVKAELASLAASAPNPACDVETTIGRVLRYRSILAGGRDCCVEMGLVRPQISVNIHPSVLRQMLVTAIRQMLRLAPIEPLVIDADLADANVWIVLSTTVAADAAVCEKAVTRDILIPDGVTVELQREQQRVTLWIGTPFQGAATVLAVDDNRDMVGYYRRCTEGTRYRIVHANKGKGLFQTIEAAHPDVIVLDIMLPDMDGWELLMHLHAHPATRQIPVIVCTVVREEDLALSLGASLYLAKPVRPGDFVKALDQVLPQPPPTTRMSSDKSQAAC